MKRDFHEPYGTDAPPTSCYDNDQADAPLDEVVAAMGRRDDVEASTVVNGAESRTDKSTSVAADDAKVRV